MSKLAATLLLALSFAGLGEAGRLRQQHRTVALKPTSSLLSEKVHARELTRRVEVRKAVTDTRDYVQTTFDTGIKVLVVTDPEAEKAAFAVAVSAGSLEDPEDFQGLAHFCEHMLFLGSEKYPDKETFTEHLATYGGNHNAYTSSEATVYFNEITFEGLDKGLDIFAQFFIKPTFNRSMVNQEIHAVDSEHKKNMPDTTRKLWHLLKSRSSEKNPEHKFSTGDLDTLKTQPEKEGKDLVTALQKWHAENYCPKRLHLVMVGKAPAAEQLELAHKAFDAVPKNDACKPRPVYTEPAFSPELGNVGDWLTMKSQGTPEMWVQFPMAPRLHEHYKSVPEAYLLNALGHYGDGGLKAALMKEDLSQSFAPMMDSSVAGTSMLVQFQLTEKGRENPERVLELLFGYLNVIKKGGIDDANLMAQKQWREVHFDYQAEPTSQFKLVQSLGSAVSRDYAPEDLLTGGYLIDEPDKKLSMELINTMDPKLMNVAFVDPKFDEKSANELEKYYQTKYHKERVSDKLVQRFGAADDKSLAVPPKLKYVPTELNLIKEGSGETPVLVEQKGRVAIWWQGMNQVELPKAVVMMKLGFPVEQTKDITGNVLAAIHSRVVQRILEGPTDELQMCGLSYGVSGYRDALSVTFSGFDQHMESMMDIVLPAFRDPQFEEADFEAMRRQTALDLADVSKAEPYRHAMSAYDVVSVKGSFHRSDLLAAVSDTSKVNSKTYKAFLVQLFKEADLTVLYAGNINKERAHSMTKIAESHLKITREQEPVNLHSNTSVLKRDGTVEVRIANPIPNDPNSATLAGYQVGIPNIEDRVKLTLLGDIIQDPVFAMLRTTHQLGYVVFGYTTFQGSVAEVRVLVQGFRENPDAVDLLIESAVKNITTLISGMPKEAFKERKNNVKLMLTKKPKTLEQEVSKSWSPIWYGHHCFDKREKMLAHLEKMDDSTQPLVEMWEKTTAPGTARHKVVVKLFGGKSGSEASIKNTTAAADKKDLVVTMLDSLHLQEELKNSAYWPDKTICE